MSDSSSKYDAIIELALAQRNRALRANQRHCLMLSGTAAWCADVAKKIACLFSGRQLWVTRQPPEAVEACASREVLQQLGGEVDLLAYDCHDGFDVDAFGAASGLIRGGGLLLLLTPPLDVWPLQADPEAGRFFKADCAASNFIKRFIHISKASAAILMVAENESPPPFPEINQSIAILSDLNGPCRTLDQRTAVAAIVDQGRGQPQAPLVLVSDRGRGKSSALGIAAAELLQQGCKKIIATAPRLASVVALFERARQILPEASYGRGVLKYGDSHLRFIAPDELIETAPDADLLLVDEAAAIPTPMLEKILSRYQRLVFATTVHGYEGTGRGFALRFNKVLDLRVPGWQQLRLQQPIRWADDDALEQFVFDALLLNAAIASENQLEELDLSACQVDRVDSADLMSNKQLLSEVFGLLVLAHYRTRPNDLRQLLDSPGLQLYVMRYRHHVVAAVLLGTEGGMDEPLARLVYQGRRRLQGHLIPQSLATHAGLVGAPTLRYLRIMRIAVHPLVQGRGLGTALIRHVCDTVTEKDCDCIGASFGLTSELLRFWQALGFVSVRLGLMREHSSGSHSLIMLRPVSESGQQLLIRAHKRMQQQLPALLSEPLHSFDKHLAESLMMGSIAPDPAMNELDWQDVVSFAYGLRGYEFCLPAIVAFVATLSDDLPELNKKQNQLLSVKVIDRQAWPVAVKSAGLAGRAEATNLLRQTLRLLLEHHSDQAMLARVRQSIDL